MLRPHMDKRVISDEHEFIAFKGNCAQAISTCLNCDKETCRGYCERVAPEKRRPRKPKA